MAAYILHLRRTAFVLWDPHKTNPAPQLIIGAFQSRNWQISRSAILSLCRTIPMYSESMPQPVPFANFEDFVTANAHSGGAIYQVTIGRMRRPAAGGGR